MSTAWMTAGPTKLHLGTMCFAPSVQAAELWHDEFAKSGRSSTVRRTTLDHLAYGAKHLLAPWCLSSTRTAPFGITAIHPSPPPCAANTTSLSAASASCSATGKRSKSACLTSTAFRRRGWRRKGRAPWLSSADADDDDKDAAASPGVRPSRCMLSFEKSSLRLETRLAGSTRRRSHSSRSSTSTFKPSREVAASRRRRGAVGGFAATPHPSPNPRSSAFFSSPETREEKREVSTEMCEEWNQLVAKSTALFIASKWCCDSSMQSPNGPSTSPSPAPSLPPRRLNGYSEQHGAPTKMRL
mmetsp:Transcript_50514/g.86556  ORF Transcript_50514/g.86556 Transcript_50514/m.86556 type:complete len:299 (-) Transcript_50514:235-1131(-)